MGESRRRAIDLAYRLRRWLLAVTGWPTRGVKVMAFADDGRLLLVRHRYGGGQWMLPGGGIGRRESPAVAASREIGEETGCALGAVAAAGVYRARSERRRDTVHLFRARLVGEPVADGVELAAVALVDPADLPDDVSPATRRRIEEWLGSRVPSGEW